MQKTGLPLTGPFVIETLHPGMIMLKRLQDVAARVKEKYEHRRVIIGRSANLTKAKPDENRQCNFRNMCANGCPFGGYFSTQSSTLPAANKTTNLTLRP